MRVKKELLLGEWAVLALLREEPRHGYAVATLTARDGDVGRVWAVGKPHVYRAIEVLEERGLVEETARMPGEGGPTRIEKTVTPAGRKMVDEWLYQPESRLRNLRSAFVLKLILLERRGLPLAPLLEDQRQILEEMLRDRRVGVRESVEEFPIVEMWRLDMTESALKFTEQAIEANL